MTIQVFQLNDWTWYAAETLEEAAAQYSKDSDGLPSEELCVDPFALSDEAMDRIVYHDDMYDSGSPCRSFREELQRRVDRGFKFPCFFATTEV